MKKNNVKWFIVLVVLLLVAAGLWYSYLTDPLEALKETTVEVVEPPEEVQPFMENVLDAISRDDKRKLYGLFGKGDAMAFNRNVIKRHLADHDFCPAEVREYRKLTRPANGEIFYQVEVFSTRRNKKYLFTIEKASGKYIVSSMEETM